MDFVGSGEVQAVEEFGAFYRRGFEDVVKGELVLDEAGGTKPTWLD